MVAEIAEALGLGVEGGGVEILDVGHRACEVETTNARHADQAVHGLTEDLARLLDGDKHQAQVQDFDDILGWRRPTTQHSRPAVHNLWA